jgi:hypothetical protein
MVRDGLIRFNRGQPRRLGRRFWLYCAGHGFSPTNATREVGLLVADALEAGYVPNLSVTGFADWVAQMDLFDEVVVWLDCCSSTAYSITLGVPFSHQIQQARTPARRFILKAAQFSKRAFEDTSRNPPAGIFTSRMLGALRGDVGLSPTGYVTSTAIADFFLNTRPSTDLQEPAVLERDPIDLIHLGNTSGSRHTLRFAPAARLAGKTVTLIGGAGQNIGSLVVAADNTATAALVAGLYKV